MYKREGMLKTRKMIKAPALLGAAGLKLFSTPIKTKPARDMKPPNPSFQRARTSPASANPQSINIRIIRVLKVLNGDPL